MVLVLYALNDNDHMVANFPGVSHRPGSNVWCPHHTLLPDSSLLSFFTPDHVCQRGRGGCKLVSCLVIFRHFRFTRPHSYQSSCGARFYCVAQRQTMGYVWETPNNQILTLLYQCRLLLVSIKKTLRNWKNVPTFLLSHLFSLSVFVMVAQVQDITIQVT